VVSWTQTDSVGEIPATARELRQVVLFAKELYEAKKVIFIAHSRGGLVCREYIRLYGDDDDVLALITLGTPHKGTRLSNIDDFVAEIAVELLDRVPQVKASKMAVNAVVQELLALWEEVVDLSQEAEWWDTPNEYLQELIPASTRDDIRYVAIAGTDPDLAECYLLGYDLMSFIPQLHQPPWHWTKLAWHVATVTEDLGGIPIPKIEGLHEMQDGKGDGVIAKESALLDDSSNVVNLAFPASHSLLRHLDAVHAAVLEELDRIVTEA
jgi:pimeloyl-ACP methyl ester carboxylesterase